MRTLISTLLVIVMGLLMTAPALSVDENDDNRPEKSSSDFVAEEASSLEALEGAGIYEKLLSPTFGAKISSVEASNIANEIKEWKEIPNLDVGQPDETYDIILQPGHYGRTTGRIGTSGKFVTEQQFASYIAARISSNLIALDYKVLVIPADGFQRPLSASVFLSFHLDGSVNPCSVSPSMGYEGKKDILGVHAIGFALATALGYDYTDFQNDGYTANLREYYAFKSVETNSFEGILEMGELTCPAEELLLLANRDLIADNISLTLDILMKLRSGK